MYKYIQTVRIHNRRQICLTNIIFFCLYFSFFFHCLFFGPFVAVLLFFFYCRCSSSKTELLALLTLDDKQQRTVDKSTVNRWRPPDIFQNSSSGFCFFPCDCWFIVSTRHFFLIPTFLLLSLWSVSASKVQHSRLHVKLDVTFGSFKT